LKGLPIDKVLTTTFQLKNNYEKACQEKKGIKEREREYRSALMFLRKNKSMYIPRFAQFSDSIKATKTMGTRGLSFRYVDPLSSTIRHCDFIHYEEAAKTILVYLRDEKAKDLVCPLGRE
jgi:hypothetical protein